MKKRTHTHTYFEISSRVHDFTLVVEAFFGPWTKNRSTIEKYITLNTFFFSFPFFSSSSQNTVCVCVCVCFIIASQKEARTQPRARKRREFTTRSAFSSRAFFLFFICRDIVCIFIYRKNKTKEQKPSDRRERKKGGGEVLEEFFFFGSGWGVKNNPRKKEKKQKKKKYRKKTFINFAPITGTLGRKRKKECKERESEESTSEWCVKFRFSSARC